MAHLVEVRVRGTSDLSPLLEREILIRVDGVKRPGIVRMIDGRLIRVELLPYEDPEEVDLRNQIAFLEGDVGLAGETGGDFR